jgi:hypothetical protein
MTRTAKWACLGSLGLLLGGLWAGGNETVALLASFAVWAGAMIVLLDALRIREFLWGSAFAVIMVAFNPLVPVLLSKQGSLALYLACMITVACSLIYLKTLPRLTMASVTDTAQRSEAL